MSVRSRIVLTALLLLGPRKDQSNEVYCLYIQTSSSELGVMVYCIPQMTVSKVDSDPESLTPQGGIIGRTHKHGGTDLLNEGNQQQGQSPGLQERKPENLEGHRKTLGKDMSIFEMITVLSAINASLL